MSRTPTFVRSVTHNASKLRLYTAWTPCPFPRETSLEPTRGFSRQFATVSNSKSLPDVWFKSSAPRSTELGTNKVKPDERTLKLGNTLRILHARLPTLLQSPLPQDILSPQITLSIFKSTHPHLPQVSGRVPYIAALWTSPITWGRVPGKVQLRILSERMIKHSPLSHAHRPEQFVVRWQTIGKTRGRGTGAFYQGIGASESPDKITEWLGGGKGEDDSREFTGLFIFEFDEEGRIVAHTIEHVEQGGDWEKGVGAKVVNVTDWLLGGMRKKGEEGSPCPAIWAGKEDNRRFR